VSENAFTIGITAEVGGSATHPGGLTDEQVAEIVKNAEESK
jgi:hypothetical protein